MLKNLIFAGMCLSLAWALPLAKEEDNIAKVDIKALNLSTNFLQNNFTSNLTSLVQYLVQLEVNRTVSAIQAVQNFAASNIAIPTPSQWFQLKPVFLKPNIRTDPNMWTPYWMPPLAPQFMEPQPVFPSFGRTFYRDSEEVTMDELALMKREAEEAAQRFLLFPSISFPTNTAFTMKIPNFLSFLKSTTATVSTTANSTTSAQTSTTTSA